MKERRKNILCKLKEREFNMCQHWLPQNEQLVIQREQDIYSSGSSKSFQLVTKAFCFCTPPKLLPPPPATRSCLFPCSRSGIHQIPPWAVSVSYCNRKLNQQEKEGLSAGFASWSSSPKSSMHVRAGAYCVLRWEQAQGTGGKGSKNTSLLWLGCWSLQWHPPESQNHKSYRHVIL